jgi:two-component system C4-dicarboxylate transport sensor histidine kinase DctB
MGVWPKSAFAQLLFFVLVRITGLPSSALAAGKRHADGKTRSRKLPKCSAARHIGSAAIEQGLMHRTAEQDIYPFKGAARRSVAVILISMTALSIGLLFVVSLAYFKSLDREAAETRLLLYKRSLNDTLKRYQYFPFVLAQDPLTRETLNGADNLRLNLRLERFAEESELEAIYLMDADGLVLATSNFNQSPSFLGQNYAFRPYFTEAIEGMRGNYFGIGATTGRPGYFVSEPVVDASGSVLGVMAIKLDISELQQTWEQGEETVLASNADGIVVLASNRDWLFGGLEGPHR